jgi:cbb3-type cytochrome oxidase maturation protein
MDITFYLFFMALLVSIAGWCIFLWAIRTGQFHDVEEIKFQVWPETRNTEDASEVSPAQSEAPPVPGGSSALT